MARTTTAVLALGVTLVAVAFSACGSKKKSKSEASTNSSKKSSSAAITASSGEVLIRKVSLKAGKALSMKTAFKGQSLAATSTSLTSPFEVSLQTADGTELSYERASAAGVTSAYTATSDESLTVTVSRPFAPGKDRDRPSMTPVAYKKLTSTESEKLKNLDGSRFV